MNVTIKIELKDVLRCLLGVVFIWAGLSKLADPAEFLSSILSYDLPVPPLGVRFTAVVLPWLELICGLFLLAKTWEKTVIVMVAAMLTTFLIITGISWLRGLEISCGCFNLDSFGIQAGSRLHNAITSVQASFLRNLLLLVATVYVLRRNLAENSTPA